MYASEREYRSALKRLEAQAARSELAKEAPGTARAYAESLARVADYWGAPGRDRGAVRDILRDYGSKIDLEPHFHGDKVTFRKRSTRHGRTR